MDGARGATEIGEDCPPKGVCQREQAGGACCACTSERGRRDGRREFSMHRERRQPVFSEGEERSAGSWPHALRWPRRREHASSYVSADRPLRPGRSTRVWTPTASEAIEAAKGCTHFPRLSPPGGSLLRDIWSPQASAMPPAIWLPYGASYRRHNFVSTDGPHTGRMYRIYIRDLTAVI